MLINLRNALMAGKRLPYDAEVEWIGQANSSTAPYLTTGVVPPVGSILRCRFRFTDLRNSFCAIGFNLNLRFGFGIEQGTFKVCTNGWTNILSTPDTSWHDWLIDETQGIAAIDTTSVYIRSHAEFTGDGWYNGFTLFRRYRGGASTFDYPTYGAQCASLYIGTANDVLFDGIPVRFTNENGVSEGALYDRRGVGGMNPDGSSRTDGLYRGRGSAAFAIGPDKS